MFLWDKNRLIHLDHHQHGMTLIEVLVVIVLLAIVMAPALNALSSGSRTWNHTRAVNPHISEANTAMTWISRDIRGATQPSTTVEAVTIENEGGRLIIYSYNEDSAVWQKIIYEASGDQLLRTVLSNSDPAQAIAQSVPSTGSSGWTTLVNGLNSSQVFTRNTGSRVVDINLQIADTSDNPSFQPFTVASAYTVRSSEVGAITGAPVPDTAEPEKIAPYKVVINGSKKRELVIQGNNRSTSVSATIWPVNATNKSVTWTSANPEWIKVDYDPNNSLNATIQVAKKRSDFSDWDWFWLWFPPNVTVTVTPVAGGQSDTITIDIGK